MKVLYIMGFKVIIRGKVIILYINIKEINRFFNDNIIFEIFIWIRRNNI